MILTEWGQSSLPENLSEKDFHILRKLANSNRISLLAGDRKNTYRVSARSWVGNIQLDSFDLSIFPKIPFETVYGMCFFGNQRIESEFWNGYFHKEQNILEWVGQVFIDGLLDWVHSAKKPGYSRTQANSSYLRGRYLPQKDFGKNWQTRERVYCEFEKQSTETPVSRVLALTRDFLLGSEQLRDPETLEKAAESLKLLPETSFCHDWRLALQKARVESPRLDLLNMAELILSGFSWDLRSDDGQRFETRVFLLDMNQVFESFLRAALVQNLPGPEFRVSQKGEIKAFLCRGQNGQGLYEEVPDFGIFKNEKLIYLLDAKYKDYDSSLPDKADIRQLALYLDSFSDFRISKIGLVYPGIQARRAFFLRQNREIELIPICLLGKWDQFILESQNWARSIFDKLCR